MKRMIAALVVLVLLISPSLSLGGQTQGNPGTGIFIGYTTSQKLRSDLRWLNDALKANQEKLALCEKETGLLTGQNVDLKKLTEGLEQDKADLKQVAADYKKSYEKADDARLKCEESKPSRATWFGLGYITGLLTAIAAAFGL